MKLKPDNTEVDARLQVNKGNEEPDILLAKERKQTLLYLVLERLYELSKSIMKEKLRQ